MPNIASPWYKRAFVQKQTTFGTVKNSTGTWDNTGAQFIRIPANGFKLTPNMPKNVPPEFVGTRSSQLGILGRKLASFTMPGMDLIPSGAAGTVPDLDLLLSAAFGVASTVIASTSVTYNLSDAIPNALSLLLFQHGFSTLTQLCAWGGCVTEVEFTFNQDFMKVNISGQAAYLLDSDNFSNEDTIAKAGLTAFPAEPGGTPSYAGTVIPGFGPSASTAVFDGGDLALYMTSGSIRYRTGYRVVNDTFQSGYGSQIIAGERSVTGAFQFRDSDAAALIDIKQKAKSNNGITAVITVGQVAGSRIAFTLNNLQMIPQAFNDQNDWVAADFPESMAHPTSATATDELIVAFT